MKVRAELRGIYETMLKEGVEMNPIQFYRVIATYVGDNLNRIIGQMKESDDDYLAPRCPRCWREMILKLPPLDKVWKPFWSCPAFPNCHGVRHTATVDYPYDEDAASIINMTDDERWEAARRYTVDREVQRLQAEIHQLPRK